MGSLRQSPTMVAAQDLGFLSIHERGPKNSTCMKGKTTLRKSNGMGPPMAKESPSGEQLLPGIPNEITLGLIAPKLSWRAFPILSFVSRAWEEAIQTNSNWIYTERVRANSSETLVIHHHSHSDREVIALYSASENCCYELPPLPCLRKRRVLEFCECIALGNKIYILGGRELNGGERALEGLDPQFSERVLSSGEVYVLDLVRRQWKWEQCASMLEPRFSFGCGVMDNKIYVFGGTIEFYEDEYPSFENLLRSEVYDTQKNAWSPIMPMNHMIDFIRKAKVTPVGKEFFLYDSDASTFRVYNPAKDEWRSLERFWGEGFPTLLFVAEGKIYSFSHSTIDVYDVEQKSWIKRHTNSFAALQPDDTTRVLPLAMLSTKDELFLTATMGNNFLPTCHCKGFDSEKKVLVWQKARCSFRNSYQGNEQIQFPIQL